eukprot:TRINITY_DN4053_c0_g1_i1.p1 TRINITY_DN4053_c0_g1~~TRINITY_DN4053_c0_g1_i1.p1  ORF type:complete len:470 (+),score=215.27 TRINITY_DN4053_c0_g1_i1:28-1410(+)
MDKIISKKFLDFVNLAPTPFQAVDLLSKQLVSNGFTRISESASSWSLAPGGHYFFTRNNSALVAFSVGGKFAPGNGFNIIGAHTDSPVLKVKPISKASSSSCLQVGVEPYGGGLWHTWFDRDLGVAGRLIVKNSTGALEQKLVHINRPILRIPSLAIHLDRSVKDNFQYNTQTHVLPIIASEFADQLGANSANDKSKNGAHHHTILLKLLSDAAQCNPDDIVDMELSLCDTQPAQLGGPYEEFILSPRLDNLMSSFIAIQALLDTKSSIDNETRASVVALFDNEEVGSASVAGAASTLIEAFIRKATYSLEGHKPYSPEDAIRKSFVLSADMAHGVHPNYAEKHEPCHKPLLHKGIVMKENANQRYATSGYSASIIRLLAERSSVPLQEFVIRNDSVCGSTIGPILSTYGLRSVDIGAPMWSMHSIRETCAVEDVNHYLNLMKAFFQQATKIDESLLIDE